MRPAETILAISLLTVAAAQSRWTDSGETGPVRNPGGGFLEATGVDWWSAPGRLKLDLHPIRHGVSTLPGGVSTVICRDMDCDGDSDIVACEFRGRIVLYENAGGGGSFLIHPVLAPDAFGPERLVCGDLDGDGDPDLAGTSRGDGSLRWWENTGSNPWPQHSLRPEDGMPYPLDAADLDGDGIPDAVSGSMEDGAVSWWTLNEYRAEGSLTSSLIYLGPGCRGGSVELFGSEPAGTSLRLRVRAAGDRTRMGEWADATGLSADLWDLLDEGDRFLQYRIVLSTSDRSITPVADSVRIEPSPHALP